MIKARNNRDIGRIAFEDSEEIAVILIFGDSLPFYEIFSLFLVRQIEDGSVPGSSVTNVEIGRGGFAAKIDAAGG